MGRILLTLIIACSSLSVFSQWSDSSYSRQWVDIDTTLFSKSLTRTALDKVNALYARAKKDDNQVQVIKTLLYRMYMEQLVNETNFNRDINLLKKEMDAAKDGAIKSILMSILAEKYQRVYEQQRYRIYNRTKTVDYKQEDVATWTIDDLHKAITYWYQQSLTNKETLQGQALQKYDGILNLYSKNVARPTLYDLLAHRALRYFKDDNTYITKPSYAFVIDQPQALGSIEAFTNFNFTSRDSASNKWKALLLFQDLVRFHAAQKDTAALIDVDLERIQYARNYGSFDNSDSLYYAAVKQTAERFKRNRYAAEAFYQLAQYHAYKAASFGNYTKDTSKRYEYVKAMSIIQSFIPITDSTIGHRHMFNLYQSIIAKTLSMQAEEVNVPGLPFKMLVNFRNSDSLYYRVIHANKAMNDSLGKYSTYRRGTLKSMFDIAKDLPFLSQVNLALPKANDYQPHSVEVKVDALPVGDYYILASVSPSFTDTANLAWQHLYVSNISYVNNGPHYFILDRTTGKPLINATVQVLEYKYERKNGTSSYEKRERYNTDKNGYAKLDLAKNNERNIQLAITYRSDSLHILNQQYIRALSFNRNSKDDEEDAEEYEEDHAKIFYFTDRSIYRPGQKVFFKMIMLTRDRKTGNTKIFQPAAKDSLYVFLHDANDDEIDSLLVKPNEYGSFAGSFTLPVTTLTGKFSIKNDDDFEEAGGSFSVEEYKRPTFDVTLEKPKGEYKLGDSLTVAGTAKAYSGSATDGALVKYKVTRKSRFLYPWLWYRGVRPASGETTITFGEARTDAQGKFNIKFNAKPDATVDKKSLPVFDYEIEADVTDNSGETRTGKLTVSAGYHSLNIQLNVKTIEDADSLRNLFVSTTNIGGDKQPASVRVNVIPLKASTELLRKRYWQQPDTYIYTKEQYRKWFPNDEYSNESDKTTWARLAPVFSARINTGDTNKAVVPKGILKGGWYIIQAVTTDKQGNEIKDEKYVQLYSRKPGQFNGSSYWFNAVVNNFVEPGETATFLVGSNAQDGFIIQEVQHKPPKKKKEITSEFFFHNIDKNVKAIDVKPLLTDESGMGVNFVMVKDNRMYTWNQRVDVRKKNGSLDIQVQSYRNKLEPGSNETWTVKITGANKDAIAAEVLTSMYDASLDQFQPHAWSQPTLSEERFYTDGWDNNSGFTTATSNSNYVPILSKPAWLQYPEIDLTLRDVQIKLAMFYQNQKAASKAPGNINGQHDMNPDVRFDADDFNPYRGNRFVNGELQGRLAGVDIAASSLEQVVVGYGDQKRSVTGSVAAMSVRGVSSLTGTNNPLIVVDGIVVGSMNDINPADMGEITVLKDAEATAIYGARGANGVIIITTKSAIKKEAEAPVKVRTNFNETAFFFPQLYTDAAGNLSFTFTLPETLTKWKWQVLAHTKTGAVGLIERSIVSQKTLMVQMNAPRFLRQGDQIELTAKVSNLSDAALNGKATLQLFDATTGEAIDQPFLNKVSVQSFSAAAKQSTSVKFSLSVPNNFINPVTWRVVARAGSYNDGEENTIPVLSRRILVTESLSLFVRGNNKKAFEFTKLLNNTSNTLQHHSLTVEYTSEPVWYAIQSLPYLVEYPYECAEQTFNRLFANALAARIVNSHPKIKQVFDEWIKVDQTTSEATGMLKSNLQKNEELKQVLLQETPWVLQAQNEAQQQKNLAILFDVVKMSKSYKTFLEKLKQSQMESGGFAWFKGGYEDRYITQYILTGISRLKKMNAIPAEIANDIESISRNALSYLDAANVKEYERLVSTKADLKQQQPSALDIQYLYMRSLFANNIAKDNRAIQFYTTQAKQFWNKQSTYFKAMIGAALYNANDKAFVTSNILSALLENAVIDNDSAMYWKDMQRGYYWHQAPVEQQVMIIELVNDVYESTKSAQLAGRIDDMKTWLLKQKQTNHWGNTKSTADACYALVLTGNTDLGAERTTSINVGDHAINTSSKEAGSGYIKEKIEGKNVTASMGNVTVSSTSTSKVSNHSTPSWGAVYWQYFEDIEKVTTAATPLSVQKNLFTQVNTATGTELRQVKDGDALKVGDKLTVRIVLRSDRDMEYIHLKDMRAAGSEPVNVLSSYKWQDGLGYYESTRDAATNFFISSLPKGTYVFEYPLFVTHTGNFGVGIATAQCMYAPEFSSHSEGIRIKVE
jgi:TonB-dependent SusC/RagA subfamily outer membrane receptor